MFIETFYRYIYIIKLVDRSARRRIFTPDYFQKKKIKNRLYTHTLRAISQRRPLTTGEYVYKNVYIHIIKI